MGSTPQMPDNPLTRALETGSRMREQQIRTGGAVVTGEPLPSSRSASVGQPVQVMIPLTIEEREALNAKARELGIRLEGDETVEGPYGSFEAAAAAGAPVEREQQWSEPALSVAGRQTAREFIGRNAAPRLPDFGKVYGINLLTDTVSIDGMEFPMAKVDADEFRLYCIRLAHSFVLDKLNAAAAAYLTLEVPVAEVHPVQGGEGADGVREA